MADTKITALTAITTVDPAADVLPIVDVSDTSMAASGTTKKITVNQILGAGGTATLASATISGNLTLSAGTANGVPYLNASKVVTASDKLSFAQTGGFYSTTFNINSLLGAANYKSGIVVTEDNNSFSLYGGSGYKLIDAYGYSTPNQLRFYASNVEQYRIDASGVFTWLDGAGGTRMTLNSTGLGVGVASPDQKFCVLVADSAQAASFRAASGRLRIRPYINAAYGSAIQATNVAESALQLLTLEGYSINLNTNVGTAMTLDASGNVGIGVTPSAWNSNYNALDIGQNGTISGRLGTSNTVDIVSNGFRNSAGNWVYKLATSNTACRYQLDGSTGAHIWYSGAAGTAGNTIAGFSAGAMTLDASGNLLVGTTSPLSSVSGSSQIALGGAGLQTNSQAISAATATTICRSGSGGMAVVGGYNATGQYSAIIIFSYGAGGGVTVVSSQNNTGSTITYALSGVNVQITSSLALTNLTTTCIRTA